MFSANFKFAGIGDIASFVQELREILQFEHYDSPENLLTYTERQRSFVHRVKLDMMGSGSRRPCRPIKSTFGMVNLNVDAGVCEWFVVLHEYVEQVQRLIKTSSSSNSLLAKQFF